MENTDNAAESNKRGYKKWTQEDIDALRRLSNLSVDNIAIALGRPKVAIYNKAKALGIDVTKKRDSVDSI